MRKPRLRKRFLGDGDERNYLNDLITYLQHKDGLRTPEGRATMSLFGALLADAGDHDGSIMLQEHWALYFAAKCDYENAIRHRKAEIRLIRKLFRIGGPIGPINNDHLAKVLAALANDYSSAGDRARASRAQRESEKLKQRH